MKLIAIKPFSYNTRHLQAGDIFETKTEREGKLLLAVKKVRALADRPEQKIPAPPKDLVEKIKVKEEAKPEIKEDEIIVEETETETETKEPEAVIEEIAEDTAVFEEKEEVKPEEVKPVRRNTGRGRGNRK